MIKGLNFTVADYELAMKRYQVACNAAFALHLGVMTALIATDLNDSAQLDDLETFQWKTDSLYAKLQGGLDALYHTFSGKLEYDGWTHADYCAWSAREQWKKATKEYREYNEVVA